MNLSMNSLTLNTVNNAMTTIAPNGAPAGAGTAPAQDAATPADPLLAAALPATPAQVLPFQQWIGLDPALTDIQPEAAADDVAATAPDEAQSQDAAQSGTAPDALLAAMSAPLLPANLPSALPAMMMALAGAKPEPRTPANDANAHAAVAPLTDAAATPPATARAPVDAIALAPASPAPAPAASVATATATTVRADVAATAPAAASAKSATLSIDASGADNAAADGVSNTGSFGVAASVTQPASTRGGDTLALAGPPTAWRQTLHEALGERLQLQAGRGVEQATIRLEPPMLGRIDIAIRHSGGNLEVHIAASNGEVLRQLNTVSDALRSDLAGRQFSSVSVSVSETPRAQATAQAGNQPGQQQPGADGQGRGRQPGQEQRSPGLALNDAGDAGSLFSMNGRD
jgi:flagellar hook-length control protein FliK